MPSVSDPHLDARRAGGPVPLRRERVSPAPPSYFRRRTVHVLLVFVTVVLIVDALAGEKGLMQSMRVRRQYREVAASLDSLRRENSRMRERIRRLKDDPWAIESLAREQLGLIRPGEILFIIKDETPAR
jgi:cell division protein FtsB